MGLPNRLFDGFAVYKKDRDYDAPGLEEYYCGQSEYGVAPMRTEDWNALSGWLDDFKSDKLIPYETLISLFEDNYCKKIRWVK
jgi:hypothetical protein